jgi:cyanophycin synthetase
LGLQAKENSGREIDATSAIAESIAQDKELTKKLLFAAACPVPHGRPVEDVEDAWDCGARIGFPVVIKPQDGNQGKGVTVNINTKEEVIAAFENAKRFKDYIMVERYLPGSDYRLLVVGDKLVAAAVETPFVTGAAFSMAKELVDQVNADRKGRWTCNVTDQDSL